MNFKHWDPELARVYGRRYLYSMAYRWRGAIQLLYSVFTPEEPA